MKKNKIIGIGLSIIIAAGIFKVNANEVKILNNYQLLKRCEVYKDTRLSKNDFYEALTENLNFTEKEADFIVNNLGIDYQANADEIAKMYGITCNFSKKSTYDALIKYASFTEEEAYKAVENLNVSWEMNATVRLLNFLQEYDMSVNEMYELLKEEEFTEIEIENAIKTIKYFKGK